MGSPNAPLVRAAGGVIHRPRGDGVEVLLVRRDRYGDWTFPKGKLEPGERWKQAAVREVYEETGIVPVTRDRLPDTDYIDHQGLPKRVRYWAMEVAVDTGHHPDHEISGLRWVDLATAGELLSYPRDRELLEHFVSIREA